MSMPISGNLQVQDVLKRSRWHKVLRGIGWFWGSAFLLGGFGALTKYPDKWFVGVSMLVLALLCLPSVDRFLSQKLHVQVTAKPRAAAILLFVAIAGYGIQLINAEEFVGNRERILFRLNALMDRGNYTDVLQEIRNYSLVADPDLKDLQARATEHIEKIREQDRLVKEGQEAIKERLARFKDKLSLWNGSHRELVERVKQTLHDPGSFRHVETKIVTRGLELFVVMTFRAKNQLGALVLNTVRARVDLEGNILSIEN